MQYRTSLHVDQKILHACSQGKDETVTNIIYASRASWEQLQNHITSLTKLGLIQLTSEEKPKRYKTTPKGMEFLRIFAELDKLLTE